MFVITECNAFLLNGNRFRRGFIRGAAINSATAESKLPSRRKYFLLKGMGGVEVARRNPVGWPLHPPPKKTRQSTITAENRTPEIIRAAPESSAPESSATTYTARWGHGPCMARVRPCCWRLTNSVLPSGEKQTPANSVWAWFCASV